MSIELVLRSGFIGAMTGLLIVLIVLLWKKEPVSGKGTVVAGDPEYVGVKRKNASFDQIIVLHHRFERRFG